MKKLNVQWKWTIPNVLSLLRIALLPPFAVLYLNSTPDNPSTLLWAGIVVVFSGLTDLLDGWIARRFNQISDAGKLLDPLADKLTQLTVLICIATRYHELMWLTGVCLLKEVAQVIGGVILLRSGDEVRGSQWFGKVSTFTFYATMTAIVLFDGMPSYIRIGLVVLVSGLMLATFLGYLRTYLGARKALPTNESPAKE
jgi:cardiolipin synthase